MIQSGLPAARQLAACTLGDLAYFIPDIAEEISEVGSHDSSLPVWPTLQFILTDAQMIVRIDTHIDTSSSHT